MCPFLRMSMNRNASTFVCFKTIFDAAGGNIIDFYAPHRVFHSFVSVSHLGENSPNYATIFRRKLSGFNLVHLHREDILDYFL